MKNIQTKVNKCKNCGGNLVFSPSLQMLYCDLCKSTEPVPSVAFNFKHDFTVLDNKKYTKNVSGVIRCQNCGSSVEVNGNNLAVTCPYCDTSLVVNTADETFKPDFIIPFKFDKQEASQRFKNAVKRKAFLPNAFKKKPEIDKIEAFYFPAFSFDEETVTKYDGRLASDQTHTSSNGQTYTTTTYKNISGTKKLSHKNVFVETSSQLNQVDLDYILPYRTSEILAYDEKFVAGYSLEKLSSTLDECKKLADTIINQSIRQQILREYSYDRVVSFNMDTQRSQIKYAYGALPVYRLTTSYKDKNYNIFLNGQTGKVGAGLPKSKVKIAFLVVSIILIIASICLLCAYLD